MGVQSLGRKVPRVDFMPKNKLYQITNRFGSTRSAELTPGEVEELREQGNLVQWSAQSRTPKGRRDMDEWMEKVAKGVWE